MDCAAGFFSTALGFAAEGFLLVFLLFLLGFFLFSNALVTVSMHCMAALLPPLVFLLRSLKTQTPKP